MAIRDELSMQWKVGGTLVRLIMINVVVFVAMLLVDLVLLLATQNEQLADELGFVYMRQWIHCPQDLGTLLTRPWTVVTYMFAHDGLNIGHIFWNMFTLFFAGRLFQNILGDLRLLGNYVLGGFSGLLLFLLASQMPMYQGSSYIVGASAAVMAVLIGIAAYRPQMEVNLILIGPVKLMYVAGVLLILDLVSIRAGDNSGGHIAHLGGAAYGMISASLLKKGKDPSMAFARWLSGLGGLFRGRRRSHLRVEKRPTRAVKVSQDADFNATKRDQESRLNAILDKISRSGYESLSKSEREYLQQQSKK